MLTQKIAREEQQQHSVHVTKAPSIGRSLSEENAKQSGVDDMCVGWAS